jgi:hypothetical protein
MAGRTVTARLESALLRYGRLRLDRSTKDARTVARRRLHGEQRRIASGFPRISPTGLDFPKISRPPGLLEAPQDRSEVGGKPLRYNDFRAIRKRGR